MLNSKTTFVTVNPMTDTNALQGKKKFKNNFCYC